MRKDRDAYKGRYLLPYGRVAQAGVKDACDPARARELWDATEKIATELLAPRVVITSPDEGSSGDRGGGNGDEP